MSSSTNPGQAQPQQMQGTNIVSQGGLPTPEPSAPPDERRNEAETQRLQAQSQQAQPQQAQPQQAQPQQAQPQQAQFQQAQFQQSQGFNNIAAQGGLPTQPSTDNDAMVTAAGESTSDVYNKARGPLLQAYEDPVNFNWDQLDSWNDEIKARNIEGVFFDKNMFLDNFTEARLIREEMEIADEKAYRRLYSKWGDLTEQYRIDLTEHNMPDDWSLPTMPPPPSLDRILAHREMRNGNEYYVENMIGDKTYCEVKTEAYLGPTAVRSYLSSDKKVSVTEHSMKYRKKDFERFGGVLHVACKPVHTRIVKDDGRKPRRPPTTVQILFEGKPMWVVYSDMKNMMGDEADQLIREYYYQRKLECPWDVKPKRRLKVIEDDEDTELEAENGGSPRRAEKRVPSVNTNKQMDLVMAQLQHLNQQMLEIQKMNQMFMMKFMQPQGPVVKQENLEDGEL